MSKSKAYLGASNISYLNLTYLQREVNLLRLHCWQGKFTQYLFTAAVLGAL